MLKLVMMPPQNDLQRQWAPRLQRSLPDYRVVVPETDAEARPQLIHADAAYGGGPPPAHRPALPDLRGGVPGPGAEARHELIDADAAYGWVPPDALPAATRLRW